MAFETLTIVPLIAPSLSSWIGLGVCILVPNSTAARGTRGQHALAGGWGGVSVASALTKAPTIPPSTGSGSAGGG